MRLENPNTLAHQSAAMYNAPWDPLYVTIAQNTVHTRPNIRYATYMSKSMPSAFYKMSLSPQEIYRCVNIPPGDVQVTRRDFRHQDHNYNTDPRFRLDF